MSKQKEVKRYKERINWKKELSLLPGYLILCIWVAFTAAFLLWILGARFFYFQRDLYRNCISI